MAKSDKEAMSRLESKKNMLCCVYKESNTVDGLPFIFLYSHFPVH